MKTPHVYDKGKYHIDSIIESGYDEGQEYVHTALYITWLIENDMIADELIDGIEDYINSVKNHETTGMYFYKEIGDGGLDEYMLTNTGNEFSLYYFDLAKGKYIYDYQKAFNVGSGNQSFSVKDSIENYEKIKPYIDKAFIKWKKRKNKKFWEIWK